MRQDATVMASTPKIGARNEGPPVHKSQSQGNFGRGEGTALTTSYGWR